MPFLFWTLFIQSFAFAEPLGLKSCGIYAFQGIPKLLDKKMILVLNEKSLSELVIDVSKQDQLIFAPYLNIVTKGELEVTKMTDFKTVTAKFLKLDYGMPNPLNPAKHSFISLKASKKCR